MEENQVEWFPVQAAHLHQICIEFRRNEEPQEPEDLTALLSSDGIKFN